MNIFFAIILLTLESVLVYSFTINARLALLFPVFLPLLLLHKTTNKFLKSLLTLVCLLLSGFLISSAVSMITPIVCLILACQGFQLITVLMIKRHQSNSIGVLFTLSGIISSYIAYSPFSIVMETWLSNILGTVILLFSILSSGVAATPKTKKNLLIRKQGSFLRYTILSVLICISITLASLLAPYIEVASEDIRYWVNDLSFGRSLKTIEKSKNRNIKKSTGPFKSGDYLWGNDLELKKQYDLKLPHRPEIHLVMHEDKARRMQRNEGLYLKCSSYDFFDAKSWSTALPGRKLFKDSDDGETDGVIVLSKDLRNPVTYSIMLKSCASGILPCITDVSAIEIRAVEKNQNDVFYAPVSLAHLPLLSYTVTSSDVRWQDITRGRRRIGNPGKEYLKLPTHPISGRITRLAQEILNGERDKVIGVDKLFRYMRRNYKYSLKIENKSDMHPIDNFLFEEKKGHCELFASSFTLLLRSIGVPSRMSCGYSGGEYDPGRDLFTFYQDNAHAWVEIYLQEFGWVLIDPTASGANFTGGAPKIASFNGAFSENAYVQLGALVNIKFPQDEEPLTGNIHSLQRKIIRLISSPVTMSLFAVFTCLIAVFFIRKPQKGDQLNARGLARRHSKNMPGYFKLFCKYFSKMGCPMRRGQTPREYLEELKKRSYVGDEYDEMIEYFEEVCYGQRSRSKAIEKKFTAIIRTSAVRKSK